MTLHRTVLAIELVHTEQVTGRDLMDAAAARCAHVHGTRGPVVHVIDRAYNSYELNDVNGVSYRQSEDEGDGSCST